jgi:hypothetical protein
VIYDIKLCELNQFHRITNLFDYDSLLDFIEKWKEENEVKVLCKCIEYCDGYKNKSIIFWDNEHGYSLEYHEVDDEMYETIYTAMYEGGFNYGETNPINKYSEIEGFSFEHPSMGFISGKAIYKNKSCNDR